ncbi:GGDEF domain-containing protein [Clostridium omnivorum]|uniref:GGDEF domain-containing protein n=2 Tax=Clostridium omnivorum TaxID=1604902 RepID=A0ABQ5N7C1_9CLOT|nr:GGDEF domain-containing protein [Clostridium sp. E14]
MDYNNMNKEKLVEVLMEKDKILRELRLENKKLNSLASFDAMTGVLNRKSGLELLEKEFNISNINNRNIVVCFVDVDKLKHINDAFGHEEGDKLIINVASILKNSIRKTDFVIRMGGDEFLIVFPQTTMKNANKVRYRILKMIEESNQGNIKYNLSLSYGFYEYGNEIENKLTVNDLIRRADIEMYKIKSVKKKDFKDRYRKQNR